MLLREYEQVEKMKRGRVGMRQSFVELITVQSVFEEVLRWNGMQLGKHIQIMYVRFTIVIPFLLERTSIKSRLYQILRFDGVGNFSVLVIQILQKKSL